MPKELILTGRVQGVFCRYYCMQNGKKLGIHGSASNLRDGSVQVLLNCEDDARINDFIKTLKQNPYGFEFFGRIDNIEVSDYSGPTRGDYTF